MKSDPQCLEVYLNHRTALIDYAAQILGCRARAEDVVQDAFLRYSAREDDVPPDKIMDTRKPIVRPVSYLYRIVRNLALDGMRRSAASGCNTDNTALERLSAPTATPEQTALDRDRLRVLADALMELPERTRIAFDMHRIEGLSLQEVAEHLGVSVVRAHQLVKDALRHAAVRLEEGDQR